MVTEFTILAKNSTYSINVMHGTNEIMINRLLNNPLCDQW